MKGYWNIPDSDRRRVIGQCKFVNKKCPPNYIRELEGVLSRDEPNTIGIFVCNQGYSSDARDCAINSQYPLILATILEDDITSFYSNKVAQKLTPTVHSTKSRSLANRIDIVFMKSNGEVITS